MAHELMPEAHDLDDERRLTIFFMQHEFNKHNRTMADVPEIDRVRVFLKTRCTEITDTGVWVEDAEGNRQFLEADTVLLATGFRPKKELADSFLGSALDVIPIGDCQKVGSIMTCSATGLGAAMSLS